MSVPIAAPPTGSAAGGKEVGLDDIVKGYDAGEEYVLVEPAELDDITPGRSKALEISGFVDLDAIAPAPSGACSRPLGGCASPRSPWPPARARCG
ncbi:Ku protein [Streptomyces kutzneri]|uniref:Ku protein n=1 Tax=Streptomyces kutzneri TaxID=3051179 RepID=UPI003F97245E